MPEESLNVLVATDLHYTTRPIDDPDHPGRDYAIGPRLLEQAVKDLTSDGVELAAVALLGDLVHGAETDEAADECELWDLLDAVRGLGLPLLTVRGNHDPTGFRWSDAVATGAWDVGHATFLLFNDQYDEETDAATRSDAQLALPGRIAAERPDRPLVALQHNPLYPPIDDEYPYLPINVEAIREGYARAGVVASLSGHFHAGQPAHDLNGTIYCTVPAGCDSPFRYALLTLIAKQASIDIRSL